MAKSLKINVQGVEISIKDFNNQDYICLTDISKGKEGEDHIKNWMRNRNTVEYLGIWENLNNPNFKSVEFDTFRSEAGLNSFSLTPKKWVENTNAIGIHSVSGKYGGTYAHKDIAFHFAMWISPVFQLYIIKEYQNLKEAQHNQYGLEWEVKRILSKANYQVQTDAIKNYIIPKLSVNQKNDWAYTDEADVLNIVLFGCTAKQWREANPQRSLIGENIRDMASINELAILANIESLNATLIKNNVDKQNRFRILSETVKDQRNTFDHLDFTKSIKKISNTTYSNPRKEEINLDSKLKKEVKSQSKKE